ncbi:Hypothetical predicted protein [Olea europaea subsp. europaea]|uniref:Uncharacterized protein n=1 Tax=Olea europaea subsp. europaea TaxID=158383 RepID=A0A8S0T0U7_OLEEU|nr:Hypothetical predicted protein [Olea europaea subsp. europaea]
MESNYSTLPITTTHHLSLGTVTQVARSSHRRRRNHLTDNLYQHRSQSTTATSVATMKAPLMATAGALVHKALVFSQIPATINPQISIPSMTITIVAM